MHATAEFIRWSSNPSRLRSARSLFWVFAMRQTLDGKHLMWTSLFFGLKSVQESAKQSSLRPSRHVRIRSSSFWGPTLSEACEIFVEIFSAPLGWQLLLLKVLNTCSSHGFR